MTRDELWQIYVKKNPQFLTTGANFTADGLLKFFNQVWEQATREANSRVDYQATNIFESIFKTGGK